MLYQRKTRSSKNQRSKAVNQQMKKLGQSGGIRLAIALIFLTGILVVVSGTDAQNLLSIKIDAKNNLIINDCKPRDICRGLFYTKIFQC